MTGRIDLHLILAHVARTIHALVRQGLKVDAVVILTVLLADHDLMAFLVVVH